MILKQVKHKETRMMWHKNLIIDHVQVKRSCNLIENGRTSIVMSACLDNKAPHFTNNSALCDSGKSFIG